ncbi:ATP-binding cassette domain-containing protein [Alteromonas facilis]|uniref:ATP-binding cassette domain-containing protein n=1 Tax=Alteromonas facilis TaxID=2048004 RepID=UPI000C283609|nr:ATP-binding cassette domain-containing protein [Alteromonas facilis]
MSTQLPPRRFMSLLLSLTLAIAHFTAGIVILLVASWFIAACAIAGVGFNYMLPAVVIRALALIRIASGYFSMLTGHNDLLDRLAGLRLWVFDSLRDKPVTSREDFLDALNHDSEEVASIWISFVAQNSSILVSLTLLNIVSVVLISAISLITLAFSVSFFLIYLGLLASLIALSTQVVRTRRALQLKIHQHVESANIWHLLPNPIAAAPKSAPLNVLINKIQARIRVASMTLLFAGLVSICSIFLLHSEVLAGQAMFIVVPMALLGLTDWLSPSLANQRKLLDYIHARRSLKILDTEAERLNRISYPTNRIQLSQFKATNTRMPRVTTTILSGSMTIIEGSSGSGKSRLLQAVVGLLPFEGKRYLCSQAGTTPTLEHTQGVLSNALYIEQFPYCLSDTLRANLTLVDVALSDERIHNTLADVGLGYLSNLDEWLGENGRPLSGGEKKRLGLARAILSRADIVLLDEPFEGLDAENIKRVSEQLNILCAEKTVILSTHIVPDTLHVDQRVSLDSDTRDQHQSVPGYSHENA